MEYPNYVIINGERFDINVDYRNALDCIKIGFDENIGDYERALAIIYKIFGEKGLDKSKEYGKELLDKAIKFLNYGKDEREDNDKEQDMDFIEDFDYIEASFMSDYHIDLTNTQMHWWKFLKLINGLSNSDLGNCCILNKIRNIRNADASKIKDSKSRNELIEQQKKFALKRNVEDFTPEQKKNIENFFKLIGEDKKVIK